MEEEHTGKLFSLAFYLSFSCSSVPGKGWTTKCRDDITSTLYSIKYKQMTDNLWTNTLN